MTNPWLVYHWGVLVFLLAVLANLTGNLTAFRSLRIARRKRTVFPKVSILIPARDEEKRLPTLLKSLLAQDYPNCEIIVLDDNSTDGTAAAAESFGFSTGRGNFQLLNGQPLESGWVGKCWACHQLSQAATGDYLFFTDADTKHDPQVVSAAIGMVETERADLLSAWPRLVTKSWSEHLVIPLIHLLAVAFYPHWLIRLLQKRPSLVRWFSPARLRSLGAANGQFLFFRRESYDRIGGHASVKNHLVEDVGLGREIAQRMGEGMRLINCDGSALSSCRMYESFPEVWEGFTKNLRAAFETSLAGFVFMGMIQVCGFLLPFVFLLQATRIEDLVIAQIVLILLIRCLLAFRMRTSWWSVAGHPVGLTLAMAIAANSWRRLRGPGVTWKGRTYGGTRH